jgi:(5-formylfuran-3-yl)methyl phosphate synthase
LIRHSSYVIRSWSFSAMPRPFRVEYQPRLLVSVRNSAEAAAALTGGADIIEVQEPTGGSPGMADETTIHAVIEAVGGQCPISAALGDLNSTPAAPSRGPGTGLTFVRIGLASAPADWAAKLGTALALWQPARPIVVAYADAAQVAAPPLDEVFQWACEHHACGLLIDTAVKDGRGLFDWLDDPTLRNLVSEARHNSLIVALAGSLTEQSIPRVVALAPDIIGVRGAACAGGKRTDAIDAARVTDLRQLIAACTATAAARGS